MELSSFLQVLLCFIYLFIFDSLVFRIFTTNAFKQVLIKDSNIFKQKLVKNSCVLAFSIKAFSNSRGYTSVQLEKEQTKMIH